MSQSSFSTVEENLDKQGWIWVDANKAEQLEKAKTYRIEIGREHWHLRYGGLHEWFASKVPGDNEVPANALIEAGCPVFERREPIRWRGVAHMKFHNTGILLDELEGPTLPSQLHDCVVTVTVTEAYDREAGSTDQSLVGDEVWSRG